MHQNYLIIVKQLIGISVDVSVNQVQQQQQLFLAVIQVNQFALIGTFRKNWRIVLDCKFYCKLVLAKCN